MNEIVEGKTPLIAPHQHIVTKDMDVFYNPAMKENRDLSLLVIATLLTKKRKLAFPLCASGARIARLITEIPITFPLEIHANDINPRAIELAKRNIPAHEHVRIRYTAQDARSCLVTHHDYIDIDPFGSPNPFLDSSIQRITHDGILAVTATDTAALTGTYPHATIRKYGAISMRSPLMHETASRILIGHITRMCAMHDKHAQVLLTYTHQHYIKIFLRIRESKKGASHAMQGLTHMQVCPRCGRHSHDDPTCLLCDTRTARVGPLHTGDLLDHSFLSTLSAPTWMSVDLRTLQEDSSITGYRFDVHTLSSAYHLPAVPRMSTIQERIQATRTIFSPTALHTTAPPEDVREALCSSHS